MNLVPSVAGSIGTNAKALSAYNFLLIVIGQCIHNNVHIAYNLPFFFGTVYPVCVLVCHGLADCHYCILSLHLFVLGDGLIIINFRAD